MTRFTLALASLWIAHGLAHVAPINARAASPQVKNSTIPISELPTLNTNAVVSKKPVPNFGSSHTDITIVESECLDPLDAPISADCQVLCEYINNFQGPVYLQPYQVEMFEHGHCAFGIANLEACEAISIDPLNQLYGYCQSMYHECALSGYDAFIRFTGPSMAIAMSGTPAAPPYQQEPCT